MNFLVSVQALESPPLGGHSLGYSFSDRLLGHTQSQT